MNKILTKVSWSTRTLTMYYQTFCCSTSLIFLFLKWEIITHRETHFENSKHEHLTISEKKPGVNSPNRTFSCRFQWTKFPMKTSNSFTSLPQHSLSLWMKNMLYSGMSYSKQSKKPFNASCFRYWNTGIGYVQISHLWTIFCTDTLTEIALN